MKKSLTRLHHKKRHSFTLVELLVVIAIIAILVGVVMTAGGTAIRAAQRAKAANMASQIQSAVMGYYTEYSLYPLTGTQITAGTDVLFNSADKTDWQNLTWSLCGNINPAYPTATVTPTMTNARGIAFLNLNLSDVEHSNPPLASDSGIPLNPINPYTAPANQYFNIAIDANYDGILGNNGSANNVITNFGTPTMPTINITQPIAVWANCNTSSTTNNSFYVHTY